VSGIGKEYRKGDPLRGAAILMLTCELRGITGLKAKRLIGATLLDLGVDEQKVRQYLDQHRQELATVLRETENA
jgi:hypothetical protein